TDAALNNQALAHVRERLTREATRVLNNAENVLQATLSQTDLIEIEILQAGANQLLGETPEENIQVKLMDLGSVDFDEMVQFWPFRGEFWVDELGSYYYGLKSNC